MSNNTNSIINISFIQNILLEILGGDPESYDSNIPLYRYGLNSLLAVEFINHINLFTDKKIFPHDLNMNTTIEDVINFINT